MFLNLRKIILNQSLLVFNFHHLFSSSIVFSHSAQHDFCVFCFDLNFIFFARYDRVLFVIIARSDGQMEALTTVENEKFLEGIDGVLKAVIPRLPDFHKLLTHPPLVCEDNIIPKSIIGLRSKVFFAYLFYVVLSFDFLID